MEALVSLQAAEPLFADGVAMVVEALLLSPFFLFQVEAAVPRDAPVSSYEMASRLSYFLWQSMPDPALFGAAADGRLSTADGVQREARRMLADARVQEPLRYFSMRLLGLGEIDGLTKDAKLFPAFPGLLASMKEETNRFVDHVYSSGQTLTTWLAAPDSFMDKNLATHYGAAGHAGTGWQRLSFPAAQPRAGVLTHASFLATHATPTDSHLISRGATVVNDILCLHIDTPPGLAVEPVPDVPGMTQRQALEQHRANPVCASCHAVIDPLGFGLENYDAVGKSRTVDRAKLPLDAAGELKGTDVDGPFRGAVQLADKLSRSRVAADCMVQQWTRFATGRETRSDEALKSVQKSFVASGMNLRELLVNVAASNVLRYRAGGMQ